VKDAEHVAQYPEQWRVAVGIDAVGVAVDINSESNECSPFDRCELRCNSPKYVRALRDEDARLRHAVIISIIAIVTVHHSLVTAKC
jgi:hypothetical protein